MTDWFIAACPAYQSVLGVILIKKLSVREMLRDREINILSALLVAESGGGEKGWSWRAVKIFWTG